MGLPSGCQVEWLAKRGDRRGATEPPEEDRVITASDYPQEFPASNSTSVMRSYRDVHDPDGLQVIDASAMPVIIGANTTTAIIMMAERSGAVPQEAPR